jgi:putative peptide zinc metalloprotease protein
MAVVVVSAALHELGHAAACAYGGAKPGGMGMGIYVVWPAFYTDVTDAYQLDRRGRLRTDLGGVYVNAMVVLVIAAVHAATHYEPLVLLMFLLQVQVLQQMLPFLRLDGYYVVSDLVGVPARCCALRSRSASRSRRSPSSSRGSAARSPAGCW